MADRQDMTGFTRIEEISREPDETVVRTTTVVSQHEGFQVRVEREAVYRQKAPKPIDEKCYRCVIFDDGTRVCFPIPCPEKPKPLPKPDDGPIKA